MASVAICPHCYLQLSVPDRAVGGALLRCPTCAKEFDLQQAVLRTIPDATVVERGAVAGETTTAAAPHDVTESKQQTDQGIAAWFGSSETVVDIAPVEKSRQPTGSLTGDNIGPVEGSLDPIVEPLEQKSGPSGAVTLADLQRAHEPIIESAAPAFKARDLDVEPELELESDDSPAPDFDLPNVRLARETRATLDIGTESPLDLTAGGDFELDDVDFDVSNDSWSQDEPATKSDDDYSQALAKAAMPADVTASSDNFDEMSNANPSPNRGRDNASPGDMPAYIKAAPIEGPRRRSLVRTLVGTMAGGIIGLALGYYALMYLLGPTGDFLQVAHYLPPSILPGSFQKAPRPIFVADERHSPISQPETMAESSGPESMASQSTDESPNIPATFVTPVEPAEHEKPLFDNRYGGATTTEPARVDDSLAEPLGSESPTLGEAAPAMPTAQVEKAPSYTTEQLSAAIDAGRAASQSLIAGDLSDATVRRTKGSSYAKLCDVAEALTFCDLNSATGAGEELQRAADDLFLRTLASSHTREEAARIATIWIDSPHRLHGGVFLAGNISGGEIAGALYEYRLTSSDGSPLVVLLREPLDARLESAGQAVVVVGSIIEQPAEKISGYTGSAARAIWASRVLPLQ